MRDFSDSGITVYQIGTLKDESLFFHINLPDVELTEKEDLTVSGSGGINCNHLVPAVCSFG